MPCPCEPTTSKFDRVAPELGDELARRIRPVKQDGSRNISPIAKRADKVRQIALIGFGLAIGRLRTQDAGHRRIHHVQQDQLTWHGLRLGQAQCPIDDLRVGPIVLERHADSRQGPRPQCLDPVELDAWLGTPRRRALHPGLDRHPN